MLTIAMSKSARPALIRFRTILLFAGILALTLQIVVVTYNAITGYIQVDNLAAYLFRIAYGTALSTPLALMIIYPDLYAIGWLNKIFEWNKAPLKRVALQLLTGIFIACTISTAGTLLSHGIHRYLEPLFEVLVTNALISIVINLLLMTILEAWLFSRESRRSSLRAEKLQHELTTIRFEVLKNQINPHFLFNSLNVLSGLIEQDKQKAQSFIEDFARIYQYVLETIEKPVVTLDEELRFARSYMYLQQIRHGDHVKFYIDVPSEILSRLLPPLSMQVILENALKHNTTGASHPLSISIVAKGNMVFISNNLQPRTSSVVSTGIGQKNLARRYAMVHDQVPEFKIEDGNYVVKLPLIPCED